MTGKTLAVVHPQKILSLSIGFSSGFRSAALSRSDRPADPRRGRPRVRRRSGVMTGKTLAIVCLSIGFSSGFRSAAGVPSRSARPADPRCGRLRVRRRSGVMTGKTLAIVCLSIGFPSGFRSAAGVLSRSACPADPRWGRLRVRRRSSSSHGIHARAHDGAQINSSWTTGLWRER